MFVVKIRATFKYIVNSGKNIVGVMLSLINPY